MSTTAPPRRIRVVGISGSGKTTVAREVAARLGVTHIELDGVFWLPGWRKREVADGHRELRERLSQAPQGWVTCGNWQSQIGRELDGADLVVWLDHPRWLAVAQVVRRSLGRIVGRRELWDGNREHWSNLLSRDPHRNIVVWTWTRYAATRDRYAELAAAGSVPVLRLRGRRAVRRWLDDLRAP